MGFAINGPFARIMTRLPSPPLALQDNLTDPLVFGEETTKPDGAGGRAAGKVTLGPDSSKSSNKASRLDVPALNSARAMPTCTALPFQSGRAMLPEGNSALLVIKTQASGWLV